MQTKQVQGSCGETHLGKKEGGRLAGWAPEVSNSWSRVTEDLTAHGKELILHRPHYTLFFTQHQS